jgi:transposase
MAISHRKELREDPSMKVTRIGLDIAKQIFELHGVDRRGRVVVRKTLRRERVLEYFSQLPACEVALEACGGAHYWQREIGKLGHTVRLLPTNKVKPYLDGNKNNAHDAAAICEASSRPSMRWVEPKTIAQQDLQSLHRVRQVTVRQSTLLANHIRGLLLEYGIAVARGAAALHRALAELLEPDEQRLSPLLKQLIAAQWRMLKLHQQQVKVHDRRISSIAQHDAGCRGLLKVEGIGPITATALVAAAGNGRQFKNGRHLSAYLGLGPGHSNTGNKTVMLPIPKRGNRYLRTLLVHGARATLYHARKKADPRSLWLQRLQAQRGHNVAAVALANKNARIAWALLRFGQAYRPNLAHAPTAERGATPAASAPGRRAGLTLKLHGAAAANTETGIFPSRPQRVKGAPKKCSR